MRSDPVDCSVQADPWVVALNQRVRVIVEV
jgi:hypothetical protein